MHSDYYSYPFLQTPECHAEPQLEAQVYCKGKKKDIFRQQLRA